MFERLEARGRAIAAAAEARVAVRVEDAVSDTFPELTATQEGNCIALAGRGLRARLLRDARLRWIGGLLR